MFFAKISICFFLKLCLSLWAQTDAHMTEEFLQYVWENTLFDTRHCFSTAGKAIEIVHPGYKNRDAGPDFFNAKVKIDGMTHVGNVEIHQRGSDWFRHGHHVDAAYDNVILSVVAVADEDVFSSKGRPIDGMVLAYNTHLWDEYAYLQGLTEIPRCSHLLRQGDSALTSMALTGYAVERLEAKCRVIQEMLDETKNDWETCFYRLLARYWSGSVNAEPFSLLARSLPYKIVLKCADNLARIESLVFGVSGLLAGCAEDDYVAAMRQEYEFQASKWRLSSMNPASWKFARVRPVSFPTVRLALFAALMPRFNALVSAVLESSSLEEVERLLDVRASIYWDTRYKLGVPSVRHVKQLGQAMKEIVIINAVIPFLFVYGKGRGEEAYCDKAITWLEALPAERNYITEGWERAGVVLSSALQSQAVIQLKKEYCDAHRCLQCKFFSNAFRRREQGTGRERS